MQTKQIDNNYKKIDSYSALICAKYFKTEADFVNLLCVNSKFKETTEKFRFNPISIKSLKLFQKIQTQHLYERGDEMIKEEQIIKYEIWHGMDYKEYTRYRKRNDVKCHYVEYTQKNRKKYGNEIPDNVTSLGGGCFYGCSTLSTIDLPFSLTSLGDLCFSECSSLSKINLPSSLKTFGDKCFYECSSLSTIELPSSLTSLSYQCFCECRSLSIINLPSSLTSLGNACFLECYSLSTINLPSSLKTFGESCFYGCEELKGVINVPDYCFKKPWYMR